MAKSLQLLMHCLEREGRWISTMTKKMRYAQPQAPVNIVAMSVLLMLACSFRQAMDAWHSKIAHPLQAQHLPVSPSWIG